MELTRRAFMKLGALLAGAAQLDAVSPCLGNALTSEKTVETVGTALPVVGLQTPAGLDGRPAQKLILGNLITLEENRPTAKAMTVIDGRIQYIGSVETALTLCDSDTVVMDYGENYLYPGFMEAHCHPSLAGERLIGAANLVPGKTMQDYVDIMADYMKQYPDREYYKGAGWVEREVKFHRSMLDAICPDKPMVLNSSDGHSIWANSKMLELGGITPEYAQEIGVDQIRVDSEGQPTGYISENVALRLQNMLSPTTEELAEQLMAWQDFAFRNGYTAVGDAGLKKTHILSYLQNIEPDLPEDDPSDAPVHDYQQYTGDDTAKEVPADDAHVSIYQQMVNEGKWKLRTYASYYLDEKTEDVEDYIGKVADGAALCNGEYFKLIGMKVFMDGVVEAHTGWLIDDYSDQPGYTGVQRFNDSKKLAQVVRCASQHGMNVHIHSIGDAATRCALDAIVAAQKETGNFDQRNAIAHLQLIRPEDIQRLTDNHVVAVVAPLWVPKHPDFWPATVDYLGDERADACYPLQSFRDAGGVIAFHTDYPVTAIVDIPNSIFEAVVRYSPTLGKDSVLRPEESIARRDALLALTRNVAYMWHEEDRLGTLAVGKIANLSIYDKDFLNDKLEELPKAKLIATVVDGDEVYAG